MALPFLPTRLSPRIGRPNCDLRIGGYTMARAPHGDSRPSMLSALPCAPRLNEAAMNQATKPAPSPPAGRHALYVPLTLSATFQYLITIFLCLFLLTVFFDLRHHALRYPINVPAGDLLFFGAMVKGILQNGWYMSNPFLGAPQGSQLYDFPASEGAHVIFIKFLSLFSGDWVVVMNLFYLAGYF